MDTNALNATIDTLCHSVEEFKMKQNEKLSILESLPIQLNEVEKKSQQFSNRLEQLETLSKRPVHNLNNSAGNLKEERAFKEFIQNGSTIELKALSSVSGNTGEYLIPSGIVDKINSHMALYSPLRKLARVTQISTEALDLICAKTLGDVGWVGEVDEREETKAPELAKLRILAHQIYAKTRVSQKLLDDSAINLENWLAEKIADNMVQLENKAFIQGNGKSQPRGILTYDTVTVGKGEWGKLEAVYTQEAGAIKDADPIFEIFEALKAQYLPKASWLMSRSAATALRKIKDQSGTYLWQPSLSADAPNTLLGYPVYFSDDMPTILEGGDATGIVFGNFEEAYQIVDRSDFHILRDPYSAKPYVEFYATKRVGGDIINFEALKVLKFEKTKE